MMCYIRRPRNDVLYKEARLQNDVLYKDKEATE